MLLRPLKSGAAQSQTLGQWTFHQMHRYQLQYFGCAWWVLGWNLQEHLAKRKEKWALVEISSDHPRMRGAQPSHLCKTSRANSDCGTFYSPIFSVFKINFIFITSVQIAIYELTEVCFHEVTMRIGRWNIQSTAIPSFLSIFPIVSW